MIVRPLLIAAMLVSLPGVAQAAKSAKSTEAEASNAATIMAYKRDPLPVYDETGSKLRDMPQKSLPKVSSVAARVVGTKPGFVAIMIDGKPAWLRLTTVDYVGNLPSPPCEKVSMQLAMMEEDGVERSLGLGCSKPK